MNIVNETIIKNILTSTHQNSQIKVLDWGITNNIVEAGSNYSSEVSRLTISYQKDGTEMKKVLFLKIPINAPTYEDFKVNGAYEREMLMYTKILPQMYTFEEEYFTPRNYYFDDKMSIFLKDLSQSGYKMVNRLDQLDLEHSCYVLKCLAKFHGISVKVEKTFGLPDKIRYYDVFHPDNKDKEFQKSALNGISIFLDNLSADIKEKYPQQVAVYRRITWDSIIDDALTKPEYFNVLTHGDFWINNMMFKYDKYGILKKVKLLDLQICHWNNPAHDLIHLFTSSVKFEVYEKYSDLLLDTYLSTLNKVLVTLNCRTYGLEELINDIESRSNFAYAMVCCKLPAVLSDPNDPIDTDDARERVPADYRHKQENYIKISTKWFIHFAEKGILGNKNKGNRFSTDELADTINSIKS